MGDYDSSLSVKLDADGSKSAKYAIKHTTLAHGKFTTHSGEHEHEMQIGTVNDKTFDNKGGGTWVDACNRLLSAVGTEGSFEIWNYVPVTTFPFIPLPDDYHRIVRVRWNIPWSYKSGGWSTHKATVDVDTWMSGYYDVEVEGLESYESYDESDQERTWSTDLSGLIKITKK